MGEAKPLASLSSGLLARKGQAKPAMRPQGFGGFSGNFGGLEDLGWNDMGHERSNGQPASPAPFLAPVPPVVRQREELAEELQAVSEATETVAVEPETSESVAVEAETVVEAPEPKHEIAVRGIPPVAVARARQSVKGRKGKAAFTLRLDADRHLKLRLACAVTRESAQAIVTEALDRYLSSFPEIDDLARIAPGKTH